MADKKEHQRTPSLRVSPAEGRTLNQLRVKIVGRDHPHRGEYGRFTGKVIRLVTGSTMALVTLEHCQHGGDACYVSPGDIREVDHDDQYV